MLGKSFTSVASLAGNGKGLQRDVGHVATYRKQMCKAFSVRRKGMTNKQSKNSILVISDPKQKFDPSHQ